MKLLFSSLLFCLLASFSFISQNKKKPSSLSVSPLAEYSTAWNDAKYLKCNTAANANYMTEEEKKTIYILNMIRMNPSLFASSVVEKYPDKTSWVIDKKSFYYTSLLDTLRKMKPMKLIYPDSLCYRSALCHATTTGKNGTVTHSRTTDECRKQQYFSGECCHYGNKTALDILVLLLIDDNVPSLGHRYICIGSFEKLGVSIQPHSKYNYTAVLDFH